MIPTTLHVVQAPAAWMNPYQTLLRNHLVALGAEVDVWRRNRFLLRAFAGSCSHDVAHLHWLHPFCTSRTRFQAAVLYRLFRRSIANFVRRGARLVWTAHNLADHERRLPELDRACRSFVTARAHAVIVHGEAARAELLELEPDLSPDRVHVIPHGHYIGAYPDTVERSEARRELGLPLDPGITVLLFFGMIREFKGVTDLIHAFGRVAGSDLVLLIAGKPVSPEVDAGLREMVSGDRRILYHSGFIADTRVQVYMRAADAVVLPYRRALTSGAIVLAMSFGRALVVPRLPAMEEVTDDRGAVFFTPAEGDALEGALREVVSRRAGLRVMGAHNHDLISSRSWERVARDTLKAYGGT